MTSKYQAAPQTSDLSVCILICKSHNMARVMCVLVWLFFMLKTPGSSKKNVILMLWHTMFQTTMCYQLCVNSLRIVLSCFDM